jgi:hypothetical protein
MHLGKPEKMVWWNQLHKVIFRGRAIPACLMPELIGIFKLTFRQGCGSAFISSGSGSSISGWTPIRIRIRIQSGSRALMNKNWKNYSWKKNLHLLFISKTAI